MKWVYQVFLGLPTFSGCRRDSLHLLEQDAEFLRQVKVIGQGLIASLSELLHLRMHTCAYISYLIKSPNSPTSHKAHKAGTYLWIMGAMLRR